MVDSGLIRRLDRSLGQPICFLFSLLHALTPKRSPEPVKRILVVELFEMGAAIMASPAIRLLKTQYPQAEIYCLCTDTVRETWALLGLIPTENILAVESKTVSRFAFSLVSRIRQLRSLKLDLLIDLELFMRIPSIIAFLSGAKRKVGFYRHNMEGLYRGTYYDGRVAFNQNTHISKNFLALALAAAEPGADYPDSKVAIDPRRLTLPAYRSDPDLAAEVRRKLKRVFPDYRDQPMILVCPDVGQNLAVRNYPRESFAVAIKAILAARPDHLVVLIGTRRDQPTCQWIVGRVDHPQCIDFSGQTVSLIELLELISMAELLIGNDNGPLHFASMTSCRILGLFSTDSPFMYGPLGRCVVLYPFYQCSPCISAFNHKRSRCTDNRCLQTLPPERVGDYALRLLEDKLTFHTCNNEVPYLF